MNTKPVFHGSDIEKICEYYHLNQEDIVNFGANVNPIGISTHVKQVLASHLDLLPLIPTVTINLFGIPFQNTAAFPQTTYCPGTARVNLSLF